MSTALRISMVLPAYNEEANLPRTLSRCVEVCGRLFSDYEIIVVDDGSADKTAEIVERFAAAELRVKSVRHPKNRGYGAALRSGFDAATGEWIFFMDSDGQFDPGEMSAMVPYLSDFDVVAGYRIKRVDSFYRRALGWTFSRLVGLFFGVGLKDADCAFKFIRGDLIKKLPLTTEGALINTEIFYHARKQKWRIKEVGVSHYPRLAGEQSGGSLRVIFKAMKEYWRLFLKLKIKS